MIKLTMVKKLVRKKVEKRTIKRKSVDRPLQDFNDEIKSIEREAIKDVQEVERWVIERRKFFIKLGITILIVLILLILSSIFMKTKGVGI